MSHPSSDVRTRFAPSPTGFMHIGNLRTALYEYLVARSQQGQFILRIEDTDRERLVEGSVEKIYNTLKLVGLNHDEGPDIGGPFGPYVQSERKDLYRPVAEELIEKGHAYHCFCSPERLASLQEEQKHAAHEGEEKASFLGYDRHCRDLDPEEVQRRLDQGEPYVIRQKMPLEGSTTFKDLVYGEITVENKTLEDQVLLKSDGYPTYNFANVVDDHQMKITHVVRGSEYLSSTPKYQLLYDALGYESPAYIHLPLILGSDGQKLAKRHGATSFEDLVAQGYLPDAITNYLALLGWAPSESTREMYTLAELEEAFTIEGISKSPAIFNEEKLKWFNGEYLRLMSPEDFGTYIQPVLDKLLPDLDEAGRAVATEILQPRIDRLPDLEPQIAFLAEQPAFDPELFIHKKSKSTIESSVEVLEAIYPTYEALADWKRENLHSIMKDYATEHELKNATVMWPVRIAVSGQAVTPGGAAEVMTLLGRDASLARMRTSLEQLRASLH